MLDFDSEDIDGMDDDAGDEEEPLPTGHWTDVVRTPIPSHIDLAGNTSYHFAASRTVSHGCRLTMARDRLRLLATC